MPKPKRAEAGFLSKYDRQKPQRLYTQDSASCGPVRISVKASNLPVSKVRQFLHSKPSFTKFTLATRNFEKISAFTRLKKWNVL